MNYFSILAIENTTKISVLGRDNEQAVKKGKKYYVSINKNLFFGFCDVCDIYQLFQIYNFCVLLF